MNSIMVLKLFSALMVSPKIDLQDNLFQISTVGINDKIVIDRSQRDSFIHQNEFYFDSHEISSYGVANNFSAMDGPWKLLKYEKGQHFHSHTDSREDDNHLCTALLFPAISFSSYSGGEFLIHNLLSFEQSNQKSIISSSDVQNSTLVIFPVNFYHEVLPVLEGVRYVFKKAIYVNSDSENQLATSRQNIRQDYFQLISTAGSKQAIITIDQTKKPPATSVTERMTTQHIIRDKSHSDSNRQKRYLRSGNSPFAKQNDDYWTFESQNKTNPSAKGKPIEFLMVTDGRNAQPNKPKPKSKSTKVITTHDSEGTLETESKPITSSLFAKNINWLM